MLRGSSTQITSQIIAAAIVMVGFTMAYLRGFGRTLSRVKQDYFRTVTASSSFKMHRHEIEEEGAKSVEEKIPT
jgi:hypothetical protein